MTTFRPNFKETAARPRIAFIQSCWHRDIVDELRDAFLAEQGRIDSRSVDLIEVPGAFEIPLRAKLEALSGTYAAVVAAGLVVDGGIYRHEFVATAHQRLDERATGNGRAALLGRTDAAGFLRPGPTGIL